MFYTLFILSFIFSSINLFSIQGGLDTSFHGTGIVTTNIASASIDKAYGSVVQPDGKIVVVGVSDNDIVLLRYTVDGGLDTSFGGGGIVLQSIGTTAVAYAVGIQDDGKIVVTGTTDSHLFVARFLADGFLDTAGFNASGTPGYIVTTIGIVDVAYAIKIQPTTQKILVIGATDDAILVAQYTTAGVLDTAGFNAGVTPGYNASVHPGTVNCAYAITIDAEGNIVVAGSSDNDMIVTRYNADGTLDTANFNNPNGYTVQDLGDTDVAYGLGFQSDQKIIITGRSGSYIALARFTTGGNLDTTFGVASSGYNISSLSGIGQALTVQHDNTIVVSGTRNNNFVIAQYLADGSDLDTVNFNNPDGYTQTDISGSGNASAGKSLSIQDNGRLVVAGLVTLSDQDVAVVRYNGQANLQGCIDVTYQNSSIIPGYVVYPTDTNPTHKPEVKALQILSDNSIFVATENLAGIVQSQLVQLHAGGSVATSPITIEQPGVTDLIVDSHGRAVLVGENGASAWIARYGVTAGAPGSFALDTTFNQGQILVQTAWKSYIRVGEQKSGNLIAVGYNPGTTSSVIVAYNQDGTVDTTFGNGSGYFTISNFIVSDMVIDSVDKIYVVGSHIGGNIELYCILADGDALDPDYNGGYPVDTGWLSTAYQAAKLAGLSGWGGTTLISVETATGDLSLLRYGTHGTLDTPSGAIITQNLSLLSNPVVTQLQIDSQNRPVYIGYDDNYMFTGRLFDNLTMDTTFASYSSCPGILKIKYDDINPSRVASCIGISPDGALIFGGHENIDGLNSVSLIGNVVGDEITPAYQLPRYPGAAIGKVDTNFGSQGILQLPAGTPSDGNTGLYVLENGKILTYHVSSGNTILEQLHSDYTLDTTGFNAGTGYVTLSGLSNPTTMMVDASGNLYVGGDNGSHMMLFKISSTGVIVWSIANTATNLISAYAICEQSFGRIVVAGATSTSGAFVGLNKLTGAVDTAFATAGYYTTGVNAPISGAAVTENDDLVFTYRNGAGNAVLAQIYANGSSLDINFGTGTQTLLTNISSSEHQLLLQLDYQGKIILVAKNSSNQFIARRYTSAGNNDAGPVTITGFSSTAYLQDMKALSDGSTIVLGIDNVGANILMFKLNSVFAQDTNFVYPSGLLETGIYSSGLGVSMSLFNALDVTDDQGILVVGRDSAGTATFNRIYNDVFVTKVNQNQSQASDLDSSFGIGGFVTTSLHGVADELLATALQADGKIVAAGYTTIAGVQNFVVVRYTSAGELDTSFNGTGYRVNSLSSGLYDSQATCIAVQNDGKIIAGGFAYTGTTYEVVLIRYATNGTLDTSFGTGGIVQINTIGDGTDSRVYGIVLQADQKIVVVGYTYDGTTNACMVARYTTNGSLDTDFAYPNGYRSLALNDGTGASQAYAVGLQSTGKIIVVGYAQQAFANPSTFAVVRFTTNGDLDTSFGPLGQGYITSSFNGVEDKAYTLAIQADDKIVAAGKSGADVLNGPWYCTLARYEADGSSEDTTFNTVGFTTLDFANSYNSGAYALQIQADGKIALAGYTQKDSTSGPYVFGCARYTITGLLDTTFGQGNGYVITSLYGIDEAIKSMVIQPDGKYVVAGYAQSGTQDGPFNFAVARYINGAESGSLDRTYNQTGPNPGYLNMHTQLGIANIATPNQVKTVLEKSDGTYYVAADNGTNAYITYFSSDDIVQQSFGTDGVVTLAGKADVAAMMIDQDGYLVLVGGNGSSGSAEGWIKQLDAQTGAVTSFAVTPMLEVCTSIAQQSNGRYIVAGKYNGYGTLVAYNSEAGAVDTTFADNGIYNTGFTTGINALVVDAVDNVYFIVNNNLQEAITQRLSLDGTTLVWTGSTTVADASPTSNYLAFDQNNNIVVTMVDTSGSFIIKRYASANGNEMASLSFAATSLGLVTPYIKQLLIDETSSSSGNILCVGYDATAAVPFVLRILADLSGLDDTFNATGVQTVGVPQATSSAWYSAFINQEGKILVGGYGVLSSIDTPFLMRLYGNDFVGQYAPIVSAGVPGTIDTYFATSGYVALAALGAGTPLDGATPLVCMPTPSGDYYIVFDNGKLARLTNGNILDTTFNPTSINNIAGFAADDVPVGTFSMMMDAEGRLVLAGTDGSGHGWVQRYVAGNSGKVDTTANGGVGFNTTGKIDLGTSTFATKVIQQTSGRIVVAGKNSAGQGVVYGFTDTGLTDVTFGNNGVVNTEIAAGVYGLICDQYDRLIFAIADTSASAVYVGRLISSGQNDTTFGYAYNSAINTINGGAGILQNADIENQVQLAFDNVGNIVIAAHQHAADNFIAVVAYDNGTSRSTHGNGNLVTAELDITLLTNPSLTGLITSADGKILLAMSQSAGGSGTDVDMCVARVASSAGAYGLDTTFNPNGADIAAGIMNFSFYGGSNPRNLTHITIYGDGEIVMVGAETDTIPQPFLARAYDTAYTKETIQSPNSKQDGTNDKTLGASPVTVANLGITFFASSGADATSGQIARALALENDANILVALDGGATAGSDTPHQIFLKMFTTDGTPDTTFGTSGQRTVLTTYSDQYVQDMVTFTTVNGIHKAILAGYVTDSTLGITGSLLMQYNLSSKTIDQTFGGFDNNPAGIAFGDGQKAFIVGQQSNGRIILGGLSQDNAGLLLGYTARGMLDSSFGQSGYQVTNTGATGIYTYVIDSQNKISIAYNDGFGHVAISRFVADGSQLDSSFNPLGTPGSIASANRISGLQTGVNNNFKIAIDGNNQLVAAAITGNGTTASTLTLYRYTADGSSIAQQASFSSTSLGGVVGSTYTIAQLLIDEDNKITIVMYDTYATPNQIVVCRFIAQNPSSIILDTTFNSIGYLSYSVASGSTQLVTDALIHPDGRIILVGSEN